MQLAKVPRKLWNVWFLRKKQIHRNGNLASESATEAKEMEGNPPTGQGGQTAPQDKTEGELIK